MIAILSAFVLGVAAVGCCEKGTEQMAQVAKCVVEVWRNQPLDRVVQRPWPRHDDGRPLGMTAVEEPCEIVLHFPSQRTIRAQSTNTTLQQERGVVTVVAMLPLLHLVNFDTVVAQAEQLAREYGVQDRKVYETMAGWKQAPPNRDPLGPKYLTGATLEQGIDISIRVRPHPTQEGWFVALAFDGEAPPGRP